MKPCGKMLKIKKYYIESLKDRIRSLESRESESSERLLSRGTMVDSYEGQVYDTVIQVIEDANKNLFEGSRKKYILTELLRANHKVGIETYSV